MTTFEFRPVTDDEWPGFLETTRIAFGALAAPGDEAPEKRPFDLARTVGAFDGGDVVGTTAAYDFDLTLPGLTEVPAAGVTWVGVRPTHRRRGVLTGLMRHQLDEIHARDVPLAVLLASESIIYGRFGYGLATVQVDLEVERHHANLTALHETSGRVRLVTEVDEITRLLPDIYEQVRRRQPGDVRRPTGWWDAFFAGAKGGSRFGPRFYVFSESSTGDVDGYAYYRVGSNSENRLASDGTVALQGLGALTLEAYVRLWRFVCQVDLTAKVVAAFRPSDEPLRHLLADPRRLETTRSTDFLWCRIVDVAAALAARRYAIEGSVVLDVRDPFCPWNEGRWRLDGGPDGATCERTDGEPDLTLSAADVGAVYLGGTRLRLLADAGRVDEHTAGSVAKADLLFATARAPWCQTFF